MKLIPITMRRPNADHIYAPSQTRPALDLSTTEFLTNYANHASGRMVSFAEDGVSDPRLTVVYRRKWIAVGEVSQ